MTLTRAISSSPCIPKIYRSLLFSFTMLTAHPRRSVSNMLNRLHGQPESYDKKFVPYRYSCQSRGRFPSNTHVQS